MPRHRILRSLSLTLVCCATVAGYNAANSFQNELIVGAADKLSPNKEKTGALGGAARYQTFLSTDKPIYHEGEKVYVRGVLLNAANHKPLSNQESASPTIEIKGPKGDVVAGGQVTSQDSVWAFEWTIPQEQAGGEYKIHVTYPWNGHAPAERKFDIRAYRAPRLKSQITFMRDGYAAGDKVTATLDVKRAEGGVPAGAPVTVTAVVDGKEIKGPSAKVDANGLACVSLILPREIPRGEGTLALVIQDGGVVESASKTIPILLQTVDLQAYPEGGDLLAGFRNRVYFQAKQTNGKPADIKGQVVSGNSTVCEFATKHEGRGRFEFTPEANKEYYIVVSEPIGIKTRLKLPEVKTSGALIQAASDIYEKNKPLKLLVGSTKTKFRVTISKKETELAAIKVDLAKYPGARARDLNALSFDLPQDADGVLTATVWDEKNTPLAERLIFRQQAHPIKINIKADKKRYLPGDNARITVKASDENGKPVSAVVGLTVTDDSVLEMVEKREQAPHLPVMVFLEPEVEDLADAHVYLDQKNPKAAIATDLLLATQGWRRFALMDLPKFVEKYGDKARTALAMKIQSQLEMDKSAQLAGALMEGGAVNFAPVRGVLLNRVAAVPPAAPVPQALPKAALGKPGRIAKENFQKAQFFNAPRQIQIIDERPLVRDFREAQNMPLALGQMRKADGDAKLQDAIEKNEMAEKKRAVFGAESRARHFAGLNNLVVVREYAHKARPNRKPTDRVDFSETLFWNAGVKTNDKTGEATVSFALNDSVSTFRVFADAFGENGALGAENLEIEAVKPFYAEAKMPLEVSSGDQIILPVSLVNASENVLANAGLNLDLNGDFKIGELQKSGTALEAGGRSRWLQPIRVGFNNGSSKISLHAKAGEFLDNVERTLKVKPKGFPVEIAFGGMLEPGKTITQNVVIPQGVVKASMQSNTAVYPTPLANMTEALQAMIQDPYGCFEQTSSTSYPLTMAQQYFVSHTNVDPKLVETSKQKLDAGYKRLVGFWCPDRGYEWFGENPGHEALTAFGLLHFSDMSQVREVDPNMINTTRAWLLKQKDGKGGFTRKRRSLHTWIEDKDCSNAYILWALLESGQSPQDLKAELESIKAAASASQNSYVVALAANALYLAGDKAAAKPLMDKLAARQKNDGSVSDVKSSIVGSGGESLEVEGSSLATLAWMREASYAGNVEKSIKYLADSCKAGRYGSTQATVLALRAIVNYDKMRARPKAPGKVRVFIDGHPVGDWREFTPSSQGAIKLPDMGELLTAGPHKLELKMEGGGPMPYSMAVKYNALTPVSSKDCKLDINVKLAQSKLIEGAATEAKVTVINKSAEVLPNPVAIVGLPGGLEPRHDQLKELVKKGVIDAYEVLGRDLVLYWRGMAKEARVEVPISVIAAVPGTYTGPASRAYLYYTDEHKKWVDGVQVEIAAK